MASHQSDLVCPVSDWVHIVGEDTGPAPTPEPKPPTPAPRPSLKDALIVLFSTVTESFVPDHSDDTSVRASICRRISDMPQEPWFSLTPHQRLNALKHILLLFVPTNLTNAAKARLVKDIMTLLGDTCTLLKPDDATNYTAWCKDVDHLVLFLLELHPEMFTASRLQRFLWAL